MQYCSAKAALTCAALVAALTVIPSATGQNDAASMSANGQTRPPERTTKGMPPRSNANEYLAHVQLGKVSIGAEFDEHSIPTPEVLLTTEDYVAVEIAFFGAAGQRLTISDSNFSLRINGKKAVLPPEQYAAIFRNVRDPSYAPPELEQAKKEKTNGINAGGGGQNDAYVPIVHIPPEMERAMDLHVTNAALPDGDRALPVAGLLFFHYTGQAKGIKTVELLYNGPAGKATIALNP